MFYVISYVSGFRSKPGKTTIVFVKLVKVSSALSSKPEKRRMSRKNVLQMFQNKIRKKKKVFVNLTWNFQGKCRMICRQFFKIIKVRKNIIPFKIWKTVHYTYLWGKICISSRAREIESETPHRPKWWGGTLVIWRA